MIMTRRLQTNVRKWPLLGHSPQLPSDATCSFFLGLDGLHEAYSTRRCSSRQKKKQGGVAAMVVCRTHHPGGGAKGWPLQAPKGKALTRYILCSTSMWHIAQKSKTKEGSSLVLRHIANWRDLSHVVWNKSRLAFWPQLRCDSLIALIRRS